MENGLALQSRIILEEPVAQDVSLQEAQRAPDRGPDGSTARRRTDQGATCRTPGATDQRAPLPGREPASTPAVGRATRRRRRYPSSVYQLPSPDKRPSGTRFRVRTISFNSVGLIGFSRNSETPRRSASPRAVFRSWALTTMMEIAGW